MQTQRIKAIKSPKIEIVPNEKIEETTEVPNFLEFKVISEAGMKAKKKKGL